MKIEYEATFENVNKDLVRLKLKEIGAILVRPEFLQKRVTLNMPKDINIQGGWLRVRDEGNKTTLTLKTVHGDGIESQKEILLEVNDFDQAVELLTSLACEKKAYQENKRELWKLNDVEITIDEWPFLEPYVEIEGQSEEVVRATSQELGFDYSSALFGTVSTLYSKKYNLSEASINNNIPRIVFDMDNPFIPTPPK